MLNSLMALSFGGVIGIGIAVGVVVVAIVILIIWLVARHDHKKQVDAEVDKLNEEEGVQDAPVCDYTEKEPEEPAKEVAEEPAEESEGLVAEEPQKEAEPEPAKEPAKPAPASVKKVVLEEGQSYNRSMKARLILSDDAVKAWYSDLKNEALSYKGARCSISWKQEKATYKRQPICKFMLRGKVLCVCFALEPDEIKNPSIKVEDISGKKVNAGTPVMLRIKNNRRVKQAKDLIGQAARKVGLEKTQRHAVDYAAELATRSEDELVAEGLIKITKATRFHEFTPAKKK